MPSSTGCGPTSTKWVMPGRERLHRAGRTAPARAGGRASSRGGPSWPRSPPRAGDVGDESRCAAPRSGRPRGRGANPASSRLHQRRVERVRHPQELRPAPRRPRSRRSTALDRVALAAHHQVLGAVEAATPTAPPQRRERGDDRVLRRRRRPPSRPPPGSARMSRPRSATSRRPSSSENTPATQAAAYSPRLWPITAAGSTPHERHSAASATSSAKWRAACRRSRGSQRSLAGANSTREQASRRTAVERRGAGVERRRGRPARCRRAAAAHAGRLRALAGEQEGRPAGRASPSTAAVATAAAGSPRACGQRAASRSSPACRADHGEAVRRSATRPVLAVKHTSASDAGAPRAASRTRPPSSPQRLRDRAPTAPAGASGRLGRAAPAAAAAGASSSDDVGVGAAEAERADAGEAAAVDRRPRRRRRSAPPAGARPVDVRVALAKVQVRRDRAVLQRQRRP